MANGTGISFSFGASIHPADRPNFEQIKGEYGTRLVEAASWIDRNAAQGQAGFGWFNLPESDLSEVRAAADWLSYYETIVHVGIGGSALGNQMLHESLATLYPNECNTGRDGMPRPRFYLADNPDPDKAAAIWERVKGTRMALIGVSKSGATTETMSQFLWFKSKMEQEVGYNQHEHILVITDPGSGVFRDFAGSTACRSLEIPPSVGGRYSVLSACGLVTAGALGININEVLEGAFRMKRFLTSTADLDTNPAMCLAALHSFHESWSRTMAVMMPYSSRLEKFAEWFAQLWAESLGKEGMGTTPVRALGAVDQHSQMQLYTAGPDDKLYTLINVRERGTQVVLPDIMDEALFPLSYLSGDELGKMLSYEAVSTASALARAGRPLVWIELERLDPITLGGLIFFYEYVTALTGRLMLINPFDQPGVEQGKRYTYGLMGRESYEADAKEVRDCFIQVVSKTM